MRFDPISEQEAKAEQFSAWETGIYDFEVIAAEEKVSKKGNPMFALEVTLFKPNGASRKCKAWIVLTEGMRWQLRHFCEATGMAKQYMGGEIADRDLVGKTGSAQVGINDNGYNCIDDWIAQDVEVKSKVIETPQNLAVVSDDDDDIPF